MSRRGGAATSRFLAYVLRHHPEAIGLRLEPGGWIPVEVLLAALARHGHPVSREDLDRLVEGPEKGSDKVEGSDKRRFEVVGDRIRAAQGHSVRVELGLPAVTPPPLLYHGTVARFLPPILAEGLRAGRRTHVHLSADRQTARTVGARRGDPVILTVDAAGMHRAGYAFYRAANGVWLTRSVPPQWLVGQRS